MRGPRAALLGFTPTIGIVTARVGSLRAWAGPAVPLPPLPLPLLSRLVLVNALCFSWPPSYKLFVQIRLHSETSGTNGKLSIENFSS